MNPNAMYRKPLSVDDVLNSRMIADPLHMFDCCVISDGGAAMIVTTAERAADLPNAPIYVLGAAGAQTHWNISEMPDFTTTAAASCGPRAFAQAGVGPGDMDTVHLYDSFTITALLLLEDLGFCAKGEGGPFVEGGRLAPGGSLPVNTDGGGLSALHSGMRGLFLMVEAVSSSVVRPGSRRFPMRGSPSRAARAARCRGWPPWSWGRRLRERDGAERGGAERGPRGSPVGGAPARRRRPRERRGSVHLRRAVSAGRRGVLSS